MSDVTNDTIVLKCGCGTNMRVRASAAGKKAKCPKCGGIMTIPAMAAAPRIVLSAPAANQTAAPSDLSDLLPIEPAPPAEPAGGTRCPQCKIMMATGAKICISCGYNIETGKTLKTTDGTPGRVASAAKTVGAFALGTTLSAVGAALGGLVWFLVAWNAHVSVGYIAWGVGVLAGIGMRLGYREAETKAGVVAAGFSAFGIVGAKAVIFFLIIYTLVTGDTDDIQAQRAFVKFSIANESLEEKGLKSEKEREDQWPSALKEADDRVKKMSDEEVQTAAAEYREKVEEQFSDADESEGGTDAAAPESSPDNENTEGEATTGKESSGIASLVALFFKTMFRPFDFLWFFLAISSAYKIGRGATVAET